MEPYQQQPQQNPYEFITNPAQPPKQPLFGGSMKSRILVVVIGLILIMIIGGVISTILSSAGKASRQQLKTALAEQVEIIRVSELGKNDALTSETRGYATTVNYVMKTNQISLEDRLKVQKIKVEKVERAAKFNPKTEEALKAASSNNRYDEVMTETLDKLLSEHQKTLRSAYNSNENEKTRVVLQKNFKDAELLLVKNVKN